MLRPSRLLCRAVLCQAVLVAIGALAWGQPVPLYAESGQRPKPGQPSGNGLRVYATPNPTATNPYLPTHRRGTRLPLAVYGFSAVALRDQRQWIAGSEKSQVVFDGQLYWFADVRQREIFNAAPTRYVPALGGNCVVTYADTGNRAPGNPRYGLQHQQRLFFFAGPEQRERFRAAPERYVDADLAHQGSCIVSKRDKQQTVQGLPKTVAIVDGLRYYFLGAQQRAKFMANLSYYGAGKTREAESGPSQSRRPKDPPNLRVPKRETASAIGPTPTNTALAGYCPVSIRDSGTWTPGDPRYQTEYDGKVYQFAGDAQKALFLKTPGPYLPALGGDCAVSLVKSSKRVPGSIFYAASYQDRLYLFAGADEKRDFKASPSDYANQRSFRK